MTGHMLYTTGTSSGTLIQTDQRQKQTSSLHSFCLFFIYLFIIWIRSQALEVWFLQGNNKMSSMNHNQAGVYMVTKTIMVFIWLLIAVSCIEQQHPKQRSQYSHNFAQTTFTFTFTCHVYILKNAMWSKRNGWHFEFPQISDSLLIRVTPD